MTPDPRPRLTPALDALLGLLVAELDDLAGLVAADVLVVAVSAHGGAAASVRSLQGACRAVVVGGLRRRVELALRPPFFFEGDATRRLATLVHELLHLDPARPGHLLDERRHAVRSHDVHERHAKALAKRFLARGDLSPLAPLGHHGEVLVRAWRRRPVDETKGRRFGDDDVYDQPVLIETPRPVRSVWW